MMSYAAYCGPAQVQNWSCIFCKNTSEVAAFIPTATIVNETTNTFGYVGYSGNTVQLVFCGTIASSLKNWISDLSAGHTSIYSIIPGAVVYTGFLEAWNSVKDQVFAAVKDVISTTKPEQLYLSGHSLGAALSVLAAVELQPIVGVPIICYNYGDPRVGNTVFAEYFNEHVAVTTWRMVNERDIVPHLPGKEFGFWHIATEVWYPNATTGYMTCDGSGEDPNCSDSLGIFADSIPDHLHYMGVALRSGRPSGCQ